MRLNQFWAEHGCLIWQPYNVQVGAGTMNPATVLRVLGPEPWNVAYRRALRAPRRRPLRREPQPLAAVLPVPGHPQARPGQPAGTVPATAWRRWASTRRSTTCASWRTTGSRPRWAPGAWAGRSGSTARRSPSSPTSSRPAGLTLDPVSVEITYGLERIVMVLQGVRGFHDIGWRATSPMATCCCSSEIEHCTYNFEVADVDSLRQMFDLYEAEAQERAGARAGACRRTTMCSSARTPSTCWMRAAPSASPSARAISRACATWRARWPTLYVAAARGDGLSLCGQVRRAMPAPAPLPAPDAARRRRARAICCSRSAARSCPWRDLDAALAQLREQAAASAGRRAAGL